MSVELDMLFTQWQFRPIPLIVLILSTVWYIRGRHLVPNPKENVRPWLFATSMVVFVIATTSPIEAFAPHFFFIRVAQHVLLISLFPATFMGSNALEAIFYGAPAFVQDRLVQINKKYRSHIKFVTPKSICWFLFIATMWLWYDKAPFNAVLRYPTLRYFELFTMCFAAILHWWHVTASFPRIHKPLPTFPHIGYTWAGMLPLKIPGLVFLFSTQPFYDYPTAVFLGVTMDSLTNQQWGGVAIWMLGGLVYTSTAAKFFSAWMSIEADKPPQPISVWDNDETLRAPGL